jgi:FkbM family methyltransferase
MVARYERHIVDHTYGGTRLRVSLEDPLAEGWYDGDWSVQSEITLLRQHSLRPGARVFDIGAHQGVVALMLAAIAGPEGRVVAVEAVPHNAQVAEHNRRLNAAENMTVVNAAIAAKPGTAHVPAELNAHVRTHRGMGLVPVRAVTIDELAHEHGRPDVVFLDVEGSEQDALQGATRTLGEDRPTWCIEVHVGEGLEDTGGSADQLLVELTDMGYDCFGKPARHADTDALEPVAPGDPMTSQSFIVVGVSRSRPDSSS